MHKLFKIEHGRHYYKNINNKIIVRQNPTVTYYINCE